ncbi:hypothetical protein L226DRAFT_615035 [Lentinus tigrinus ALCF2SS1-7]|uniref:HMG box domain-containing protein n=1 Tax=Lentinus tigrinus ALCF2SS1-6 TaxID=1328759 RepID=A0A5C2S1N1_9APHY|nr:hypothetical protein L227DRAFT_229144 [Lentinus tigrinus ALCF2SS1-6]RPD72013.1 hypothetical protein L226DRAFT_615035 [Lentinus tigrinus ALCF2SS1-7]
MSMERASSSSSSSSPVMSPSGSSPQSSSPRLSPPPTPTARPPLKRPLNSFICFRTEGAKNAGDQKVWSKVCGAIWNGMDKEQKAPYGRRAAEQKQKHKAAIASLLEKRRLGLPLSEEEQTALEEYNEGRKSRKPARRTRKIPAAVDEGEGRPTKRRRTGGLESPMSSAPASGSRASSALGLSIPSTPGSTAFGGTSMLPPPYLADDLSAAMQSGGMLGPYPPQTLTVEQFPPASNFDFSCPPPSRQQGSMGAPTYDRAHRPYPVRRASTFVQHYRPSIPMLSHASQQGTYVQSGPSHHNGFVHNTFPPPISAPAPCYLPPSLGMNHALNESMIAVETDTLWQPPFLQPQSARYEDQNFSAGYAVVEAGAWTGTGMPNFGVALQPQAAASSTTGDIDFGFSLEESLDTNFGDLPDLGLLPAEGGDGMEGGYGFVGGDVAYDGQYEAYDAHPGPEYGGYHLGV